MHNLKSKGQNINDKVFRAQEEVCTEDRNFAANGLKLVDGGIEVTSFQRRLNLLSQLKYSLKIFSVSRALIVVVLKNPKTKGLSK